MPGRWADMRTVLCLGLILSVAAGSCGSGNSVKSAEFRTVPPVAKSGTGNVSAVSSCGTYRTVSKQVTIDLAPPSGFTEICARDRELCRVLTAGYPPTVTTLGYFVASGEWAAHQRGERVSPTKYLIAQGTSMAQDAFPALKDFIRERAGRIPDNSRVPESGGTLARIDLGVLEEGPDFISPGIIIKVPPSALAPSPANQVAINTAFATRGQVLSLYTHCDYSNGKDVD